MNDIVRKFSAAAILTLALAAQASSAAALVRNCGNLPVTEIAQSSAGQATDSRTFVAVVGSNVNINVAGPGPSCVFVSFSAQAFAPGDGGVMLVMAVLDGAPSVDGTIQFVAKSIVSDAHAYNFLFPSVSPGPHFVRMQYFSGSDAPVNINGFNMIVRHR